MPINIPDALPAKDILESEKIFLRLKIKVHIDKEFDH